VIRGSCLCGAVRLEIQEPLERSPEACHCSQCRKQSGSFLIAVSVRRTALHIEGNESVAWYKSSEKVQRGFCRVCGSTLFWKPIIERVRVDGRCHGMHRHAIESSHLEAHVCRRQGWLLRHQ
jgi:hypothetical protein